MQGVYSFLAFYKTLSPENFTRIVSVRANYERRRNMMNNRNDRKLLRVQTLKNKRKRPYSMSTRKPLEHRMKLAAS